MTSALQWNSWFDSSCIAHSSSLLSCVREGQPSLKFSPSGELIAFIKQFYLYHFCCLATCNISGICHFDLNSSSLLKAWIGSICRYWLNGHNSDCMAQITSLLLAKWNLRWNVGALQCMMSIMWPVVIQTICLHLCEYCNTMYMSSVILSELSEVIRVCVTHVDTPCST